MTEEYKRQLINYTTGLLNQENPDPKDFNLLKMNFQQYKDSLNDFFEELDNKSRYVYITGILENENYDIVILYGAYIYDVEEVELNGRGFLIYLDRDNNLIDFLFKDKNGNYLRGFHKLYLDETSNRVYGVIGHPTSNAYASEEPNLFAYMNNLLMPNANGEHEVDISRSYNLYISNLRVKEIVKHPTLSSYLMISDFNNYTRVIQYTINVGSSNERKIWDVSYEAGGTETHQPVCYGVLCHNIWFSGDNPLFRIVFVWAEYSGGVQMPDHTYYGVAKNIGDNIYFDKKQEITRLNDRYASSISNSYINNAVILNENEMYFITAFATTGSYFQSKIQKCTYSSGTPTISIIYSSPITTNDMYYYNFYRDTDGTIYLVKYFVNSSENKVYISLLNFTKYYADIDNGDWLDLEPLEYEGGKDISYNFTTLQRNYNISRIIMISGDVSNILFHQENLHGFILTLTNLFNLDGYNGTPYINQDILVPKYSNLYNGNNLIFSRNLYNITKQSNTTMSSVAIPSTYLNDTAITKNDLIGKTLYQLNSNPTEWTKNIYEVVDLNFINTISVIDEDTNTPYIESAIKLNNSITDGGITNYANTPCTKYRVNYADNTSLIGTIYWETIDSTHKQTIITIYVNKAINNIDFISSDGSVIYIRINGEFQVDASYTIKQKIRIE